MAFGYSPEKLASLQRTISDGRLAPYIDAASGTLEDAIRLYELNASLSSIFYSPLQTLEVAVRNSLDAQFCAAFGPEWIELRGPIRLQKNQRDDLEKAIHEVATDDEGRPRNYTRDMIIAELNFGFWVGLLGPKNETEIWRKAAYKAFPKRPRGVERQKVQGALNSVRRLRNRIAHHCRIIHRNLVEDHETILNVIGWVCPDTREWAAENSQFSPDLIPVPQKTLPNIGLPEIDPMPPTGGAEGVAKPTRDGRLRLGMIRPG